MRQARVSPYRHRWCLAVWPDRNPDPAISRYFLILSTAERREDCLTHFENADRRHAANQAGQAVGGDPERLVRWIAGAALDQVSAIVEAVACEELLRQRP